MNKNKKSAERTFLNTVPFFLLTLTAFSAVCLLCVRCTGANPKTAEDYFETAQVYIDQKNYRAAISNLTEALERDPSNAEAWNSRAYAYYFSGEPEKAIADYTETLRLEPEMGVAYAFRSQAYTQTGEHEKAAADRESLYRLAPATRRRN